MDLGLDTTDLVVLTALLGVGVYFLVQYLARRRRAIPPPVVRTATQKAAASYDERNFVAKMKATDKNFVVFFGSQTGTAEEFASRLAKEAKSKGFKPMTADPQDYDMSHLPELASIENSIVVFCMATYGEGDPTDNAQEFIDSLKGWIADKSIDCTGVRYAVFALGNKTFEHFNAIGHLVDNGLHQLGGTRLHVCGDGDDDANLEDDFVLWREQLWPAVADKLGITISNAETVGLRAFTMKLIADGDAKRVFTGEPAILKSYETQRRPFNTKNPYLAEVKVHRELYGNGSERSCVHIELDIASSGMRYHAGDHVAVFPKNNTALVERLGKALGVNLDTIFSFTATDADAKKQSPFPCPCSVRTALQYYVDITAVLKPQQLRELAEYAQDPAEKARLIHMTTKEGKEEFNEWMVNDHRTIVDVLEDVKSIKVPFDHLLEILHRLQVRYYSISSSAKMHPQSVHVTASVVEFKTRLSREGKGVATSWMQKLTPGEKIPIFIRASTFRLPPDTKTPVIMIGPGTGLAPFRGFIQDRQFQLSANKPVGETVFFFGCQKRAQHFLYQEEMLGYTTSGALTHLFVACSRDQAEKVYVQHHMRQNSKLIYDLIQKGAHIYLCGDGKHMARDVHEALVDILVKEGSQTKQAAEDYLKQLSSKKRFQQDVWA